MGKRDLALKSYLSDPVRYADVYNGSVFGGVSPGMGLRACTSFWISVDMTESQRRN